MTDHPLFRTTTALRTLPLLVAAALIGALVGCDTAELRPDDEPRRADEVAIESDDFTRADLLFEPVSLSPGETFSIDLMDEELGGRAARITHEGISDGRYLLRAQFDPLDPASVEVRCRNVETGTRRTVATLGGRTLKSGDVSGNVIARGDSTDPSSFHYIQDGPTTVVEVDYDRDLGASEVVGGAAFTFPSLDRPRQCTHVAFVMEDVSSRLTADGVEFEGGRPDIREKSIQTK
jgi:hypothetical protein